LIAQKYLEIALAVDAVWFGDGLQIW